MNPFAHTQKYLSGITGSLMQFFELRHGLDKSQGFVEPLQYGPNLYGSLQSLFGTKYGGRDLPAIKER